MSRLTELGRGLFKVNDHFQLGNNGRTRQLRNGHHVDEIAGQSGGVWAADESQLWNLTLRPQLVPEKQAVAQAEKALRELSPVADARSAVSPRSAVGRRHSPRPQAGQGREA